MHYMPMNDEIARKLCEITNEFYREQAESFSATRSAPWTGWQRCLDLVRESYLGEIGELSVLDLACGNLRFEDYLTSELPETTLTLHVVDDCDALVASAVQAFGLDTSTPCDSQDFLSLDYQNLDIMKALFEGAPLAEHLRMPLCDLSVSFGFMHHVPLPRQREEVLTSLVSKTRAGGLVAVSFWQFLNSPHLAHKAYVTHARALVALGLPSLSEGDFLLGWKNTSGKYRYCHSFTEAEIDALVATVADVAVPIARFLADGKTENLNEYVVLRVL